MLQSNMDYLSHPIIKQTYEDIRKIKIQGATNVAIATFEAVKRWLKQQNFSSIENLYKHTASSLWLLATARPNEPLATNGVRFFVYRFEEFMATSNGDDVTVSEAYSMVEKILQEYLDIIAQSKREIVRFGRALFAPAQTLFTHCHSSTAESVIIESNKHLPKTVIVTETRPLYQGRITAKNLIKHRINTIMIVDSASARFITDDSFLPVEAVLIGADEILPNGDAINKVGSYSIALAAKEGKKPVYVITPSLKLNLYADTSGIKIELRPPQEVWPDAPAELKIINPAFDPIPKEYITAYLTEFGLIEPSKLSSIVKKHYPWISMNILT